VRLRVCVCEANSELYYELLNISSFALDVPELMIIFDLDSDDYPNRLLEAELNDLVKVIELSHTNATWKTYLSEAIMAVRLYYPTYRCCHHGICGLYPNFEGGETRDAYLRITIDKEHKQLWMEGTHSFEELQILLTDTGLDTLATMEIRVGLTSMGNKDRGRGLRKQEEQHVVDCLLGRTKKRPKDVKPVPVMVRVLE
jgi:hypothetical protein